MPNLTNVKEPVFSAIAYQKAGAVLLFFVLFSAQIAVNFSTRDRFKISIPPQEERAAKWNPNVFRLLTFGHLPAAVDWIFIQILMDQNISHVEKGKHPKIYYDFDLIADLDPVFIETYTVGANLLSVIRDDGPGARDILLKGDQFRKVRLASFPESMSKRYWWQAWRLPFLLAYVYLFELHDLPNAAIYFREAAVLPGAPAYLSSLQKRLESPGGEYEVGLRLLNYMIESEKDDRAREELLKRRQSLFIAQFLFDLNHSYQEFLNGLKGRRAPASELWRRFLREQRIGERDPWGGRLSLNEQGRVASTTPHDAVFGLD